MTMKYFFSLSLLLKHYEKILSKSANLNKTEDSKDFK